MSQKSQQEVPVDEWKSKLPEEFFELVDKFCLNHIKSDNPATTMLSMLKFTQYSLLSGTFNENTFNDLTGSQIDMIAPLFCIQKESYGTYTEVMNKLRAIMIKFLKDNNYVGSTNKDNYVTFYRGAM